MSSAARPISGEPLRANAEARLSVEQVSYAYAANPTQAPLFTLEALSFQARPGEVVAIVQTAPISSRIARNLGP